MRSPHFRRLLASGVIAAAGATLAAPLATPTWAAGTAPAGPAGDPIPVAPAFTEPGDAKVHPGTPAQAARAHLRAHPVSGVPESDLRTLGTLRDGRQNAVRFQQLHRGVPVFGAEYAVQTEPAGSGQTVTSTTGSLFTALSVGTSPAVSEAVARQRILSLDSELRGVENRAVTDHGLVVLPSADGGLLTWHFTVAGARSDGGPVRQEVYVDAMVGGITLSYNNIDGADAAPVEATGVRVDGAQVPLQANAETDGSFTLVDSSREMFARTGGQVRTYDAERRNYTDLVRALPEDVPVARSLTNHFDGTHTGSGAVDAHSNATKVHTYLKDQLGRDSVDGKGGSVMSVVNVARNGQDYANAFWDGSKMVYGHLEGVPLSVALDVVGHEMTHGVTEHTAGLVYLNQSGALNEAISDYFGNAMETDDKGIAMTDPTAGLLGEYLCNGVGTLEDCALRDLNDNRNARTDYLPITLDIDNGGVHYNSTIVGGALWDVREALDPKLADQVVYRATQNYLTPLAGFSDMRTAVTLSAKSLKVSKADMAAIEAAFDAHGINEGWENASGSQDGTTLSRDLLPAYEVYGGVDEQAAQVSGDVYAISHGDAVAWDLGGAAFGITIGRFSKQDGQSDHEISETGSYLLDPSLDSERVVFTRVAADGVGIYGVGDQGQGSAKKIVDDPAVDETEPVTEDGALAYVAVTPDGEQDVMLRRADGTTTNVTPEAGTKASRLAMKDGTIAWAGVDGTWLFVHDVATGQTQSKRISAPLFDRLSDVQVTSDRVFYRISGGFLIPNTKVGSTPADDITQMRNLRFPTGLFMAQFTVSDDHLAYSTYGVWAALGSWDGPPKMKVSSLADAVAGANTFTAVSCSAGSQLAPSLGDGQRITWLDTTAAATDVVTREGFAGSCG